MNKLINLLCALAFVWLSALLPQQAKAQCGCAYNFETTFPEAVKNAPVVIEGQIIGDVIMYGGKYDDSYKSTKIKVYKVLKGDVNVNEVELIYINAFFSHQCNEGGEGEAIGIFMLYPSDIIASPRTEIAAEHKFKQKAGIEGIGCNIVYYNKLIYGVAEKAYSPYGIYTLKDIKKKVYDPAEQVTGHKYKEISTLPKKVFGGGENAKSEDAQAVTINSISPTTITAGTFDTLTIRGSGFTPDWLVSFRDAESYNEDYIPIPESHYIVKPDAINDTMYKVLVPCIQFGKNIDFPNRPVIIASTGKIALKKGNITKKSSQTLTVTYAQYTYSKSDTSTTIYPMRLAKNTPNGDFMFWPHSTLRNNDPANQLVKDAVEQWRCTSGVNFTVACDSVAPVPLAIDDSNSTISIASAPMPFFDLLNQQMLPAGTIRKFHVCNSAKEAVVHEIDIIFREHPIETTGELSWYYNNYTPGLISSGDFDFYTAALHELGHAHLLGHVTNENALMNTSQNKGASGVIHDIDPATDSTAAANIMSRSISNPTNVCLNAMQPVSPADCALPDCAFIDCDSPAYPLQGQFVLIPEVCLQNPDFDNNSDEWQTVVGANVNVLAKDQSMGNIIDRFWDITTDPTALFSNEPCNIDSDVDTCRLLYWNETGQKQITLTVTDANGCQITQTKTIQIIAPNCTLPPIQTQIRPTQSTCNLAQSTCPEDSNGQIIITPPNNGDMYDCYNYYAEYHETDPTVSTYQDAYGNSAFIRQSNGTLQLNCLPKGYYKIRTTDEISTCQTESIVFVPHDTLYLLLTNYGGTYSTNSTCQGTFTLNKINDAPFDLAQYTFAWSDCSTCNTPTRNNLCYGVHTLTVTDNATGCQQTLTFTIHLLCPNNGGGGTGTTTGEPISEIEVSPTLFDALANIKLTLNYDAKISLDVYNIYGQPIKTLIDDEIKAAGEYYLQHNANNISDGVYIYVVKACNETKTDIGIKE
jgi:hypothetical protein